MEPRLAAAVLFRAHGRWSRRELPGFQLEQAFGVLADRNEITPDEKPPGVFCSLIQERRALGVASSENPFP